MILFLVCFLIDLYHLGVARRKKWKQENPGDRAAFEVGSGGDRVFQHDRKYVFVNDMYDNGILPSKAFKNLFFVTLKLKLCGNFEFIQS